MKKIGILVEVKDGEIKTANYGVITAAHGDDHELYAFVLDGRGDAYKDELQEYGVQKVIDIYPIERLVGHTQSFTNHLF